VGLPDNFLAGVRKGIILNLPVVTGVIAYGFVCGVLSRQVDMAVWQVAALSGLMYSGTAQLLLAGLWTTDVGMTAALVSVLAVSLRYLLIAATCAPLLKPYPIITRYLIVSLVADENWGVAMAHRDKDTIGGALLLGGGLTLWVGWVTATLSGWYFGAIIADPARYGLDFAFTAVFLSLVIIMAKESKNRPLIPLITAALAALVADYFAGGSWPIIVAGLAGALAAALAHKQTEIPA